VSPNGGLKAAPSPPQKQNSEHTRQKEVNSTGFGSIALTCELDLLCMAVAVVLVANLIYFPKEISISVEKNKNTAKNNCFAKRPYKGVIRGN
jgi:hypothetical protein